MYFPDAYTHKCKCIFLYKSVLVVLYEGGVIVLFFRSVLLSMHNAIPPLSCFAALYRNPIIEIWSFYFIGETITFL